MRQFELDILEASSDSFYNIFLFSGSRASSAPNEQMGCYSYLVPIFLCLTRSTLQDHLSINPSFQLYATQTWLSSFVSPLQRNIL